MTDHIEGQRPTFAPILSEIAAQTSINVQNDVDSMEIALAATEISDRRLYNLLGVAFLMPLALHNTHPQHMHFLRAPLAMAGEVMRYNLEGVRDNFLALESENPALARRYGREVLARLHPESMSMIGM